MKKSLLIIIIAFVVLIGIGIYFFNQGTSKNSINTNPSSNNPTPITDSPVSKTLDLSGVIANNHGHSVVLTKLEQDAGQAVVLQLIGPHTHELSLSSTQVQDAAVGNKIEIMSSVTLGHSHLVTFN